MITEDQLSNWFTYHPVESTADSRRYAAIRAAGLVFAKAIIENATESADQSAAIRKVREAVLTANSAIACRGK